ncbi:uncharacterized protein M6B38_330455 [Iris pallida]|uniref:Uncharacterized protein n=1 Tax=Iris pallida TaxID=29817 RepID=A0AAX6H4R8_IRIPA|nr:uncharacterized protein M6B38_350965 [Iris pallida]KAJ6835734.1 uncharacterized protein M6B38_330455 [Iris pallida]
MAAAEARTAWQRTANRHLVQEDAKRAPKLACCPSSTQHCDANGGNAANGQDHSAAKFVPLNWNPMNSNLPPDTKWWLQLQPNFGSQKDFTCEQPNTGENEHGEASMESSAPTPKQGSLYHKKSDSSVEPPWMVSTAFMKSDSDAVVEGMKTATNISQQPLKRKGDMDEYFFNNEQLMDWKPRDRLINNKTEKFRPDMGTPWMGGKKCEPWWHISDTDEFSMLVAQKSLEHVENCDLPMPTQTMHVSKDPLGYLDRLDGNSWFSPSAGSKLSTSMCNTMDCPQHSSFGSMDEKYRLSSEVAHLPHDTNKLHSDGRTFGASTAKDVEENVNPESNRSRSQLLEALCHSQTRARKAEMAAQRACDEKEDIIKILFQQASHLFAYKQWLHMLQLESLCLQLRIKDHKLSKLFPTLPWMPPKKDATERKGKQQGKCGLCDYAVVFAVGLGLAGAGLLLSWTLGWLLPHF